MQGITPPDKTSIRTVRKRKYRVYFHGRTRLFGSAKSALAFQTKVNHAMSQNATAVNALCSEVYTLYRSFWMQLDPKTQNRLAKEFEEFDRSLFLMITRSHHPSGTTFTFTHFENCARSLNNVLSELNQHPDTKRSTFARHRIAELRLRTDYLTDQVTQLLGPLEN